MASSFLQASNPFCQNRSKTPESRHSWNRRWAELDAQNLLEQHGTIYVGIISLKDALVSPLLDKFMQ